LASESLDTYQTLELRRKPIDKANQIAAIKYGGILEKKLHHVETSCELMIRFTFM